MASAWPIRATPDVTPGCWMISMLATLDLAKNAMGRVVADAVNGRINTYLGRGVNNTKRTQVGDRKNRNLKRPAKQQCENKVCQSRIL